MNKLALILIIIAVVVAIGSFIYINKGTPIIIHTNNTNSSVHNIEIRSFAFSPSNLTINRGERVTWTNNDQVTHTITSNNGSELNSGDIGKNHDYSHVFNAIGTYDYHCSIHTSMKGRIVVV